MTKVYQALTEAEAKRNGAAAASEKAPEAPTGAAATAGDEEIARIRAILFGNLPDILDDAIERLTHKVDEQGAALRADLDALEQKLDRRIGEIEARSNHGRNELRDQILSQTRLLTDSIQERSEQAIHLATQGVESLRESKLDRADFSAFLRQTARHFAHTDPEPGADADSQ